MDRINHHDIEPTTGYKHIVAEIKNLCWEKLTAQELQTLMYLSAVAAVEFAEALRVALRLHPHDEELRKMSSGELETTNLALEDYDSEGDHSQYLRHFLEKHGLDRAVSPEAVVSGAEYISACRRLDDETRAMSVFSREEELAGIFKKILQAPDWDAPGLNAYKHFLEQHIAIDTNEGGHHDLTKQFPIDERVAAFYKSRLDLYRSIPKLFEK